MMGGIGFGFGGVLMTVIWLLFWAFVVSGAVWLILTLARPQGHVGDGASGAIHILEERLARGEIDTQDFRYRRAAIEGASR
jgi:putative membrane protein